MCAMRFLLLWTVLCSVALAKKDPSENDPMMLITNQLNFLDIDDESYLRNDNPRVMLEARPERIKRAACENSARETTQHVMQRSLVTTRSPAASRGNGKSGKGGVIIPIGSGGSSGSETKESSSGVGNVAKSGASGSGVNSSTPRGSGGKGNGVKRGRKRCNDRAGGSARSFGAPRVVKQGKKRVGQTGTGGPVACASCPAILDVSGDEGNSNEIIRVRSISSSDAPGESGVFSRDSGGLGARDINAMQHSGTESRHLINMPFIWPLHTSLKRELRVRVRAAHPAILPPWPQSAASKNYAARLLLPRKQLQACSKD
ncbi:hypothetical protein ACLKA6_011665 [Drosophila palustris]